MRLKDVKLALGCISMVTATKSRRLGATLITFALLAIGPQQPAHATDALPPQAFTTQANGQIELSVQRHSPVFAEFDRSAALTRKLAEALTGKGFAIALDKSSAKSVLVFSGDIALMGGPNYFKGVKVPIGEATEKALQTAKDTPEITRADVVQTTAAIAINSAALSASITPFWKGLALDGIVSAIGSATGVSGAFNKAVAGDPRGWCVSRCADWNKVNQTVYLRISMQSGDSKQDIRVVSKAFAEAVVPDQVLDRALIDGIAAIRVVDAPEAATK